MPKNKQSIKRVNSPSFDDLEIELNRITEEGFEIKQVITGKVDYIIIYSD